MVRSFLLKKFSTIIWAWQPSWSCDQDGHMLTFWAKAQVTLSAKVQVSQKKKKKKNNNKVLPILLVMISGPSNQTQLHIYHSWSFSNLMKVYRYSNVQKQDKQQCNSCYWYWRFNYLKILFFLNNGFEHYNYPANLHVIIFCYSFLKKIFF